MKLLKHDNAPRILIIIIMYIVLRGIYEDIVQSRNVSSQISTQPFIMLVEGYPCIYTFKNTTEVTETR